MYTIIIYDTFDDNAKLTIEADNLEQAQAEIEATTGTPVHIESTHVDNIFFVVV